MRMLLFIGVGGFVGAVSRFLLGNWMQSKFLSAYPYGTFSVNLIGGFLVGILFALSERGGLSQEMRMLLVTGLLGGFTTFSAFSLEIVLLIREGQLATAGLYILGSVLLGLVAVFLGISLIKLV